MTTQTADATTLPENPQPTPTGTDPAATPQPQASAATPTPEPEPKTDDLASHEDPDLRDLAKAQAEVAKAEKGEPAAQPNAEPTPTSAEPTAPKPTQPPAQPGTVMVPKARLDQVLAKAEANAQAAAYWKGVADAKGTAPQGTAAQPAAAPEPTPPADPLAEIDAQRIKLAQDFDDGKLSAQEWKKQEIALDRRAQELREQNLLAKVPTSAATAPQTDLLLEERTAQIAAQHPYVSIVFPADGGQPDPLNDQRRETLRLEAERNLRTKHPDLQPGPRADLLYRQELGRLSDIYGPIWFPNAQVQRQAPANAQPGGKPALSTTAQQRLDKLNLQAQQPPNPGSIGQAGGQSAITETVIEAMSEDEIADLPAHVRARFTGVRT